MSCTMQFDIPGK